jgi:hypothetical protein
MFHSFLRVDWNSKSQCMLKPPDSYGSVLAGSAMIRFGQKENGWKRDKKKGTPDKPECLVEIIDPGAAQGLRKYSCCTILQSWFH